MKAHQNWVGMAFLGTLMIAPTILGLMILNIIPFFQTIYMSFFQDESLLEPISSAVWKTTLKCSAMRNSGRQTGTPSTSASSLCRWAFFWH